MSSSFKSRTFYSVCPAFSIKKYEELEKILVKTITSKMKLPSILKKIQYISEMPKYVRRLFSSSSFVVGMNKFFTYSFINFFLNG